MAQGLRAFAALVKSWGSVLSISVRNSQLSATPASEDLMHFWPVCKPALTWRIPTQTHTHNFKINLENIFIINCICIFLFGEGMLFWCWGIEPKTLFTLASFFFQREPRVSHSSLGVLARNCLSWPTYLWPALACSSCAAVPGSCCRSSPPALWASPGGSRACSPWGHTGGWTGWHTVPRTVYPSRSWTSVSHSRPQTHADLKSFEPYGKREQWELPEESQGSQHTPYFQRKMHRRLHHSQKLRYRRISEPCLVSSPPFSVTAVQPERSALLTLFDSPSNP